MGIHTFTALPAYGTSFFFFLSFFFLSFFYFIFILRQLVRDHGAAEA